MGTVGALNVPTLTGATTVPHERLDPGAYLAGPERFGVSAMGGDPPVYGALLRHPEFATRDLSAVRSPSSGAAPPPVEMTKGLQRVLGSDVVITEGYSLTEVTMGATIGPAVRLAVRSAVRRVGTVGLPVHHTEVRIVDPAGDDLTPLPTGEPGEVLIRDPQVMVGYKGYNLSGKGGRPRATWRSCCTPSPWWWARRSSGDRTRWAASWRSWWPPAPPTASR